MGLRALRDPILNREERDARGEKSPPPLTSGTPRFVRSPRSSRAPRLNGLWGVAACRAKIGQPCGTRSAITLLVIGSKGME